MSFLELRQLSKVYADGTQAVRSIDLELAQAEFVVLLGPSGCGKTTTLRMVAGLELATTGAILLAGRDVTQLPPSQRDIGFVFQFYALYPHLSVAENIAFPLRAAGLQRGECTRQVAQVAQRLGISEMLPRRPRELSGGDQQRVALARAMVRRPALYLMDEPLGTLDAAKRLELRELIRAQQLELGVTTIYVTHDQEEAMSLADRIVVMRGGAILQQGHPREVYRHPRSLFVARFVGSPGMNLLAGQLEHRAGTAHFVAGHSGAACPLAKAGRNGPAVLGVRPEDVRLDAGGPIQGKVVLAEFLGDALLYHVDTDFGRLVLRAGARDFHERGALVRLSLDPAACMLFDPDTEELLA